MATSTSSTPGDIIINSFLVASPRAGVWNATVNFLSGSIVEEIFTPGVVAEYEVADPLDFLGNMQLAGDEFVYFNATKPTSGQTMDYKLLLNSVKEVDTYGALHMKVYKLMCVSWETLAGQGTYVQGSYNSPISSIVSNIFGQIGSSWSLTVDPTQGNRNMNITNQPAYSAIEMLRKEAVSAAYPSSNYMFWQNQFGFYFATMEWMMNQGDVKAFGQENTVGTSIYSDVDKNILAWKPIQMMDAVSRIKAGVLQQQVSTFNIHTNEFKIKAFTSPALSTELGNYPITTLPSFLALFPNAMRSVLRYINPNSELGIGQSYMPDNILNKMVNMAQMMEQQLHFTVIGDPVLAAGKTVTCFVPQVTAQSPPPSTYDILISGRWLCSKVEHSIQRPDVRPRWLCNIEALKGVYQS